MYCVKSMKPKYHTTYRRHEMYMCNSSQHTTVNIMYLLYFTHFLPFIPHTYMSFHLHIVIRYFLPLTVIFFTCTFSFIVSFTCNFLFTCTFLTCAFFTCHFFARRFIYLSFLTSGFLDSLFSLAFFSLTLFHFNYILICET